MSTIAPTTLDQTGQRLVHESYGAGVRAAVAAKTAAKSPRQAAE